jgi:hypothetical protein
MIKRRFLIFAVASAAVLVASAAFAAPSPKLKTFGTGDVTVTGDSATIVNQAGEYGGVYIASKSQSSKRLDQVVFEFTSRGDVQGGAPRFSIPIDSDGQPNTDDGYAFLDAYGCGAAVGPNTTVITLVSTQSPTCAVNYDSTDYTNWATFAAANPTYRTVPGGIPFIIADVAGRYVLTDIVLKA